MKGRNVASQAAWIGFAALALVGTSASQSVGAANSFGVLSSADVTFKNHVNISQAASSGGTCPGSVGCPADVGGVTILMGRGNASGPDTVSGDVAASANAAQGFNCAGNAPGTTAVCLGNDSEIAGLCATGGGAIDTPSECALGADSSGSNPDVTTLLPQGLAAISPFSSSVAALATTQTLAEIALGSHGVSSIATTPGLNVIAVPAITTGTKATITITAGATDTVVINIGSSTSSGSLQLGNGASVLLSGGITPDRVVFNLIGSSTAVQLGNNTTFNGTIVAAQGQFTSGDGNSPSPVVINGALLFGGSIAIGNNTNLTFYPFAGVSGNGNGNGTGSGSAS